MRTWGIVVDGNGHSVDYEAAVALMDDEICGELYEELTPCSNQVFFEAYAEAHREKFGEDFAPAMGGQW